ncbi:MAG: amidohydrolase [Rhodospirillales bacterium]|nr:amidohydrolase [Rhodospirillales bacterium]
MTSRPSPATRVVAIEEHYLDPALNRHLGDRIAGPVARALEDFGDIRLKGMDEAGIDFQVLSHAPPGLQAVAAEDAASWARSVNDRLHAIVQANPTRLSAFASLPTAVPAEAVRELERCVERLGFKGAMVHGPTGGRFLDHRDFWPILECAQGLDVPIYLHPSDPLPAVRDAYFGDMAKTHPMFMRAAWGFTFETGTHAMRLVLAGVFDAFPGLRIVLGHLGEAIPFLLARIDEALARDTPMKTFRKYFSEHFYITTSGFFSDPALLCCLQEVGVDRIMFSVDWPFASNTAGTDWIRRFALNEADKEKILFRNAERLLKLRT